MRRSNSREVKSPDGWYLVINDICKMMFEPDNKTMANQLKELNKANVAITQRPANGFTYKGTFFACDLSMPVHPRKSRSQLDPCLHARMDAMEQEHKILRQHAATIRMALAQMTDSCSSFQDLRNALPEAVLPLLSDNRKLLCDRTTTMEEAWNVTPTIERQIKAVVPLIEQYAVMGLIL